MMDQVQDQNQARKNLEWEVMTLEKRQNVVARLKQKYPHMIPIVVKPSLFCANPLNLPRRKYLINHDQSIGCVMDTVRREITLSSAKGLFFFVQHQGSMQALLGGTQLVSQLHKEFAHDDGALHICVQEESAFG